MLAGMSSAISPIGPRPGAGAARRRAHVHRLRMRIAGVAVAVFLALWVVLFVQLATGRDPGLNDATATTVVQSADPSVAEPDFGPPATDGSSAGSEPGAVVTRPS